LSASPVVAHHPAPPPSRTPTARRRAPGLIRELAVLAFLGALTLVATRPLAARLSDHTLYGVDPPVYVWTVNWLSGHLLRPSELFEGNIFHPTRHVAVLSDLALGTALLVAPLRPVIRDPIPLYNVGVLLSLTFGAWAVYTLARALTSSAAAGLLSAILGAYGSHQLLHVYQLALINIGFLALFLLGLGRAFRRPGPVSALLLALAFVLNALSSAYFAVAGAVMALIWGALHARRLRSTPVALTCAGAILLVLLMLVPYARAFLWLQATEDVQRTLEMNVDNAFKPARDLTSGAYLYRRVIGGGGERLFPGLVSLGFAAFACVRRVPGWAFYAVAAAVLTVLSLGPVVEVGGASLSLPYAALFAIPPLNALMHPYSFAGVAVLCLAVLAGLGLSAALRARRWLAPIGLILALVDVAAPGARLVPVRRGLPAVYRALDGLPPGPALEVPLERPEALIWAARHGRPVLNGAGALAPAAHARLQQWIHGQWLRPIRDGRALDVDRTGAMRQLLRMPVRYVIVRAGTDPDLQQLVLALDRSRRLERVRGAFEGDALYRRREELPPSPAAEQ
jgi:hypothetical protein